MSQGSKIKSLTGQISLKDQLHWALLGSAAWKCVLLVPFLIFILVFGTQVLSDQTTLFVASFYEALFTSFIALLMVGLWTVTLVYLGHRRLTDGQRTVIWTFSESKVVVTDQVGNQIVKPWSQISRVKFTAKGVRMTYKPLGSIWVPARLLTAENLVDLKVVAKGLNLI